MSEGPKDFRSTFECLGANLGEFDGENVKGDCPFCGKEFHFYLNTKTGQWDCKHCLQEGNVITFLGRVAEQTFKETHERDWERLARQRSIVQNRPVEPVLPVSVFKRWRMGWTGSEWYIPCFSEKGTVRDIRRWNGKRTISTSGRPLQLFGIQELAQAGVGTIVWICEGEWDVMALRWLLDQAGRSQDVVVGVPGAGVFKQDWCNFFKGMRVRLAYDHDKPGDDGSMKAGDMVRGLAASVEYVCWPERRPSGWDIKDFVLEGRGTSLSAQTGVQILEDLLRRTHRRAQQPSPEEAAADEDSGKNNEPVDFSYVVNTFKAWVEMDQDFYDALAVVLSVCLANDIPGDPLWMYVVGPPGSGKTLILMGMQSSARTRFYSTLTPASLVSGFNVSPDPSLLPELNGKAAIFKDGTELTSMHPDARREIYGVLRGAFDGDVLKRFGNGVLRQYKLHFNMAIGVTPVIHADGQATMGERFLKIEMRDDDTDGKLLRALGNLAEEIQMQEELSEACRRFLLKQIDPAKLPPISAEAKEKIVALAQLVAVLRAQVDRESFGDRDIKYRPVYEVGTRVVKQLAKLGQILTFVFEEPEINDEIIRILQHVSFDTMVGFHLDIVRLILREGNTGLTRNTIAKKACIPETTANRRLQDLEQLQVLDRIIQDPTVTTYKRGPLAATWRVSDRVAELWRRAVGPVARPLRVKTAARPLAGLQSVPRPSGGPAAGGGR